jgi:hypothetical protein
MRSHSFIEDIRGYDWLGETIDMLYEIIKRINLRVQK